MELVYQYLWRHKMFGLSLPLSDGRSVSVIDPGRLNTDAGPDFFNAKVLIDGEMWAGNVEIHVRASDWYRHGHDKDRAYDSVVLHVVAVSDREVTRTDGSTVPQAEVTLPKDFYVSVATLRNDIKAVKCAPFLREVPPLVITDWMEALGVERLQAKAARLLDIHRANGGDWYQTLFTVLARALGFGLNSEPFEALGRNTPLKFLMRHADSPEQLEAILFGQAGLLDPSAYPYDDYYRMLCREYTFLRAKYGLRPIPGGMWKFARTRPQNLPHRRIALLAAAVGNPKEGLASAILEARGDEERLRQIFSWHPGRYWLSHYAFGQPETAAPACLGKGSVGVLLINVAAPFYYAHASLHNDLEGADDALRLLYSLPPEQNSIISAWKNAGIKVKDAQAGQALIHLRKEYCDRNRCFDCRIGHRLLRHAAGAGRFSPFSCACAYPEGAGEEETIYENSAETVY